MKAQCLWDVAIKMNSSIDSTNVLTSYGQLLSILEFIFISTSHKHCAFTITYVRFGNLSLFTSCAMLMRPRNLKTAVNKIYRRQLARSGVLLHETAVHGC